MSAGSKPPKGVIGKPGIRTPRNYPPNQVNDLTIQIPTCLESLEGRTEEPLGPVRNLITGPPMPIFNIPWHTHKVETFATGLGRVNTVTDVVELRCDGLGNEILLKHFHCVLDGKVQAMYLLTANETGTFLFNSGAIGALHTHDLVYF